MTVKSLLPLTERTVSLGFERNHILLSLPGRLMQCREWKGLLHTTV